MTDSLKKPFQFRRTKSERMNRNLIAQGSKSEPSISVTRATQAKTRKYIITFFLLVLVDNVQINRSYISIMIYDYRLMLGSK